MVDEPHITGQTFGMRFGNVVVITPTSRSSSKIKNVTKFLHLH